MAVNKGGASAPSGGGERPKHRGILWQVKSGPRAGEWGLKVYDGNKTASGPWFASSDLKDKKAAARELVAAYRSAKGADVFFQSRKKSQ